jgi:hypothetical protein
MPRRLREQVVAPMRSMAHRAHAGIIAALPSTVSPLPEPP